MTDNGIKPDEINVKLKPFPIRILILGFLVFIVSIALFIGILIYMVKDMHSEFVRFSLPGTKEIELTETGLYSVYYEHRSKLEGKYYNTPITFPDMALSLKRKGSEEEFALNPPVNHSASYSWKDTSGELEFEFSINEPGVYVFSGMYEPGTTGPAVVLSVHKENFGYIFIGFLLAGLMFYIMMGIPTFIFIIFIVQLRDWLREKRALERPLN